MQPFTLTNLIFYFLKLGTIGFGGPVALLGYMQRDLIEERKWFTKEEYHDGLAFAQLLPGPLAAQIAIYFGYKKGKILGATIVGIAFILPSFLMVLALAYFYVRHRDLSWINAVFYGMSAAIIAVIVRSAYHLAKLSLADKKGLWCIAIVLFVITVVLQKVQLSFYLAGGLAGILLYAFPKNFFRKQKMFSVVPLELFFFFFKAALSVYGGGIALLPYVYAGVVGEHHWLTAKQFLDAASVGMITPGPFLITVAFIGFLVDGFPGSAISVLGVFLPVWLFVILLLPWYHKISGNTQVRAFVSGVTAAVAGGIAGSAYLMGKTAIVDGWTIGIALLVFLLISKTKIPDPVLILAAGVFGFFIRH